MKTNVLKLLFFANESVLEMQYLEITLKYKLFKCTNRLLSVHALIEIFKLEFAFFLRTGMPDAMTTLDPLLLEGVAACSSLVRLLAALGQDPLVQLDSQPRLQINEWHGSRK